jgi:hypothetical protein
MPGFENLRVIESGLFVPKLNIFQNTIFLTKNQEIFISGWKKIIFCDTFN